MLDVLNLVQLWIIRNTYFQFSCFADELYIYEWLPRFSYWRERNSNGCIFLLDWSQSWWILISNQFGHICTLWKWKNICSLWKWKPFICGNVWCTASVHLGRRRNCHNAAINVNGGSDLLLTSALIESTQRWTIYQFNISIYSRWRKATLKNMILWEFSQQMERGSSLILIPSFYVNLFWQLKIICWVSQAICIFVSVFVFCFFCVRVNGQIPCAHWSDKKIHHRMIND